MKKSTINNKLGKISNKIYLQNKYIRNDKELLGILKLILNKRKNKKRNKSHSNIIKKLQEHRNEKQGAVSSEIFPRTNDIGNCCCSDCGRSEEEDKKHYKTCNNCDNITYRIISM